MVLDHQAEEQRARKRKTRRDKKRVEGGVMGKVIMFTSTAHRMQCIVVKSLLLCVFVLLISAKCAPIVVIKVAKHEMLRFILQTFVLSAQNTAIRPFVFLR